jgi:hypothetical protein
MVSMQSEEKGEGKERKRRKRQLASNQTSLLYM